MVKRFSAYEIVTLAVYLLGGEARRVDTEDVAIKANEIAPGRFTWRKYYDQINLELVRVYLSDAKKPEKGGYLCGSGKTGWTLTEKGTEFAKRHIEDLDGAALSNERHRRQKERTRLLASTAFQKFMTGGPNAVSRRDIEVFFRIDDYVVGEARERKVARIVKAFGNDPELGGVVRELANRVRGGEQNRS